MLFLVTHRSEIFGPLALGDRDAVRFEPRRVIRIVNISSKKLAQRISAATAAITIIPVK